MNRKKGNRAEHFKIVCCLFIFLSALSPPVFAELDVQLEVPDSVMVLGDRLLVQLKVDGAKSGVRLVLPEIEGLRLRQVGTPVSSSRTTIINGKIDRFSGLQYNIAIHAQKTGTYRIPPIRVRHGSDVYSTDPIPLKVVPPGEQSSMKLDLSASKSAVFPQEPVTVTLKWSIQERIEEYEFHFPLLEQKDELQLQLADTSKVSNATELQVGNFNIPFDRSSETVGGETFTVYSVEFRIFIPSSGEFTVPAASVKAQVRRGSRVSTNFFGDRVRVPKMEKILAVSQPLRIRVNPLPESNRPESFSGAIGDYTIELLSETQRAKVGDPVEITIRISGQGRLDRLQAPLLSEIPAFRDQFAVKDNLQPGDIEGDSISFRRVIRPKRTSIVEIPAVPFSFFNIEKGDYVTIASKTLPLKVLPTKTVSQSDVVAFNKSEETAAVQYTKKRRGLQGNYTFEDVLQSQTQHWSWGLSLLFPPLLYVSVLVLFKRRRNLRENQALLRAKSAKAIKNRRFGQ